LRKPFAWVFEVSGLRRSPWRGSWCVVPCVGVLACTVGDVPSERGLERRPSRVPGVAQVWAEGGSADGDSSDYAEVYAGGAREAGGAPLAGGGGELSALGSAGAGLVNPAGAGGAGGGDCAGGACQIDSTPTCGAVGELCVAEDDCCAALCVAGRCVAPACRSSGPCVSDAECCVFCHDQDHCH
jgi:hypothetical protein